MARRDSRSRVHQRRRQAVLPQLLWALPTPVDAPRGIRPAAEPGVSREARSRYPARLAVPPLLAQEVRRVNDLGRLTVVRGLYADHMFRHHYRRRRRTWWSSMSRLARIVWRAITDWS